MTMLKKTESSWPIQIQGILVGNPKGPRPSLAHEVKITIDGPKEPAGTAASTTPAASPYPAATPVLLAASPLMETISGCYFEDCNESEIVQERPDGRLAGVAPYALDPVNADRLWSLASAMTGVGA